MADIGLGKLITTAQERDAVHIAVLPATAADSLRAGEYVIVNARGRAIKTSEAEAIGIVDPFLCQTVQYNERFWVWLKPGSIATLRHTWTHSALDGGEAVQRLKWLAEELGLTYERMMGIAEGVLLRGDEPALDHEFEGVSQYELFWSDFCAVTGHEPPEDDWLYFFTCGGCS